MEDSQSQPPEEDWFIALAAREGWSQNEISQRRWDRTTRHVVLREVIEQLSLQPDRQMYIAEIARAINRQDTWVRREIQAFKWAKVFEEERRDQRVYYKLRPGMAEQYQQWLTSQQSPDEPQP